MLCSSCITDSHKMVGFDDILEKLKITSVLSLLKSCAISNPIKDINDKKETVANFITDL